MSENFAGGLIMVSLGLMFLLAAQHIIASVAFLIGWTLGKVRGGKFCLWLSTFIVGPTVVVLSCAWLLPQLLGELFAWIGLSTGLGEGLGLFGAFYLMAAPAFILAGGGLGELGVILYEDQESHDEEVTVKNRKRPVSYRKTRNAELWKANSWVFCGVVIAQCAALYYTFG